jgi:radical SAM superfamily enzyme YgiQ (UPF0313 family)
MSGSTIDWDYIARSDYVCFSLLSFCSHRGYELMKQVRSVTEAPIICGGSHSSVLDRECLDHADFVVRNEGEAGCIELLAALDAGAGVQAVAGISYKDDEGVIRTRDRDFVADLNWSADYSLIDGYGLQQTDPVEAWQSGRPWFHFPVSQASRGCPRNCRFCFVRRELGSRYRKRSTAAIRQEVEGLAKLLRRSQNGSLCGSPLPVLFVDNDFCLDRRFTLACLRELEDITRDYELEYHAFTRIESAQDADFVRGMKELGVAVLFLGIESINDQTLRLYAKGQRREDISKALKVCRKTGMSVLGFFVLGADTDAPDVVRRSVEFAIENQLHNVGLFSLYGFPVDGAPELIASHRFIHHDWRFFSSNFVVHFPLNMKPSRLQREIINGYDAFNDAIEGSLPIRRRVFGTMQVYSDYLESVEDEFYDRAERLVERRLLKRSPAAIKRLAI